MKKLLVSALALMLALTLTACEFSLGGIFGGPSAPSGNIGGDPVISPAEATSQSPGNGGGTPGGSGNSGGNNTPGGSGGGNNAPSGGNTYLVGMWKTPVTLPKNVYVEMESSMNGGANSTNVFAKIGDEFYAETRLGDYRAIDYARKDGNVWKVWSSTFDGGWYEPDEYSGDEFGFYLDDKMLYFMSSSWYYSDMKEGAKTGTESIAGVKCDVYSTDGGTSTLYHDPNTNLILKADHTQSSGGTLYEVVKWDASVKSFAGFTDVEFPK